MDDFDNFSAVSKGSNLASIFGSSHSTSDSSSLIYTPPKQPRTEEISDSTAPKLQLILANVVYAYKFSNGAYQSLGKMGLTLLGCESPPVYQLLLYKTKQDLQCKIRLSHNTTFLVMNNNYASFYSEDLQNFSVMFQSHDELSNFAKQLALLKSCILPFSTVVSQDIKFSDGPAVEKGAIVNIRPFSCYMSSHQPNLVELEEERQMNISALYPWMATLMDMKSGAERIVVVPRGESEPWKEKIGPDKKLVLLVLSQQETSTSMPPQIHTSAERSSAPDSSSGTEENSAIKSKGTLVENVLSNQKSHKSGLMTRMARLGQATLPLRGAVAAQLTDSEEESSPSLKPRIRSKPPSSAITAASSRLALYQPPPLHPSIVMQNDVTPYTLLTSSNLPSSDTSLAMHFAESRTQSAELRIGISKLADKLDLVLNKVVDLKSGATDTVPPAMDPTGLLTNIQALVKENHTLKSTLHEQNTRIDTLNERLYNLMLLNPKSATRSEEESSADLKQELQAAKEEISCLRRSLAAQAKENEDILNKQIFYESKKDAQRIIEIEKHLEDTKTEIAALQAERERLLEEINTKKGEVQTMIEKVAALEEENTLISKSSQDMQNKFVVENNGLLEELANVNAKLEQRNCLKPDQNDTDKTMTKALMNSLYRNLYSQFSADNNYSGSEIRHILAAVIRQMTLEFLKETGPVNTGQQITVDLKENFPQSSFQQENQALQTASSSQTLSDRTLQPENLEKGSKSQNKLSEVIHQDSNSSHTLSKHSFQSNDLISPSHSTSTKTSENIKPSFSNLQPWSKSMEVSPSEQENSPLTYNQIWQTNEPPPLPVFDDADDEDGNVW